jgi:hypothetical protein
MCEPKEPSYFVDPKDLEVMFTWMWRKGYWKDEQRYLDLFEPAGDAPVVGEASVFYTCLPKAQGVAERICRFNPDARLIYLVRDPVERTISHYWHSVRYFGEYRPIEKAIREDPQYLDVGDYAMQLAEYYRFFPREQILILTFEDLTEDPSAVMATVSDWLGLDRPREPPKVPPQNVRPEQFEAPVGKWRQLRLQNPVVRAAVDHLPLAVRRLGAGLTSREVNPAAADTSRIADYLRPVQQGQVEALSGLLGRDFPRWTTLNALMV